MSASSCIPRQWFMERRIKLQHLRLLAALARFPALHRAATEIGVSQPAASKLLADLEYAVRHILFERRGRTLIPNTLGTVLTHRAQAMLRELEQASDELSALIDGRRGRVTIGAIDGPTVNYLADVLAAMRARFPLIEMEVETGSSQQLFESLSRGEIEVMFGRVIPAFNPDAFSYREIEMERFAIVGRKDHPQANAGPLDAEALQKFDWVIQNRGSTLRLWFEAIFSGTDLPLPGHIVNTNSLLMTLAYLQRSDALSVISEAVALQQAACGQLSIIPVTLDLGGAAYGLIRPRHRPVSPALSSFLETCEQHLIASSIAAPSLSPTRSSTQQSSELLA